MKLLLVIYRQSLEEDVRELLRDLDVKAFTEALNSLILAAMEEDQASWVIAELQAFGERLSKRQNGAKVPMRVFALPCERAI
jgi:hypothetical protein